MTEWQNQIRRWVETACAMEVLSPKPGNVSPGFEFADASVRDFLNSARAMAPALALAETRALGETILEAVELTRGVVSHNTNLGIILLIAPLAVVPSEKPLSDGIGDVLKATTVRDSQLVYQAIRLAQPGGLGETAEQDLQNEPTLNLVACMQLAAHRDMIARQYSNSFEEVLTSGLRWLREAADRSHVQPQQIAWLAVRLLAAFGDSLIARKCGQEMSDTVRARALEVLEDGWSSRHDFARRLAAFDAFLREDGNRRNPGTTADMVAAILFAALREGLFVADADWLPEIGGI